MHVDRLKKKIGHSWRDDSGVPKLKSHILPHHNQKPPKLHYCRYQSLFKIARNLLRQEQLLQQIYHRRALYIQALSHRTEKSMVTLEGFHGLI